MADLHAAASPGGGSPSGRGWLKAGANVGEAGAVRCSTLLLRVKACLWCPYGGCARPVVLWGCVPLPALPNFYSKSVLAGLTSTKYGLVAGHIWQPRAVMPENCTAVRPWFLCVCVCRLVFAFLFWLSCFAVLSVPMLLAVLVSLPCGIFGALSIDTYSSVNLSCNC